MCSIVFTDDVSENKFSFAKNACTRLDEKLFSIVKGNSFFIVVVEDEEGEKVCQAALKHAAFLLALTLTLSYTENLSIFRSYRKIFCRLFNVREIMFNV